MARKKSSPDSSATSSFSDFFSAQTSVSQSTLGRSDVYVGNSSQEVVIGLPFKAFSLRYFFQNDCFPLSRMTEIYGVSGSCKTALLFEIFKWHVDNNGGYVYNNTEARDTPDLRSSIIGHDRDKNFPMTMCSSVEDWQKSITSWFKKGREIYSELGGCPFPVAIGVDSLTGVASESEISGIWEKGHSEIGFAKSANIINSYMKFMFNELRVWPYSFIGVNHAKIGRDARGFPQIKVPGGFSLDFHSTIKIFTQLKDKIEKLKESTRVVNLKMDKNSLSNAGEDREIQVQMKWSMDEETGTQHTFWDWHEASVTVINNLTPTRKSHACEFLGLENIDKSRKTADCNIVGLKKASWSEIGQAIEENSEVKAALDKMFSIRKRKPFAEKVPYSEQMEMACEEAK